MSKLIQVQYLQIKKKNTKTRLRETALNMIPFDWPAQGFIWETEEGLLHAGYRIDESYKDSPHCHVEMTDERGNGPELRIEFFNCP